MNQNIINSNTLAHAIKEVANVELTARPFNRFEPDDSTWWLIPTGEWPAYKYGKIFFESRPERIPNQMKGVYAGFNLEKGLGQTVANFYHKSLIMRNDWIWNKFFETMPECLCSFDDNAIFAIIASYIPPEKANFLESPESFLAQKESFSASKIYFTVNKDKTINVIEKKINNLSKDIADFFESDILTAKSFDEVILKLKYIPQIDWVWIDFYCGVIIPSDTPINASQLWNKHFEKWTPWLR